MEKFTPLWPDAWVAPLVMVMTAALKDVPFAKCCVPRSSSDQRTGQLVWRCVFQEIVGCASMIPRIRSCKKILLMPPNIEEVDHITENMVAMNRAALHGIRYHAYLLSLYTVFVTISC